MVLLVPKLLLGNHSQRQAPLGNQVCWLYGCENRLIDVPKQSLGQISVPKPELGNELGERTVGP
jgi:hypothetical protein